QGFARFRLFFRAMRISARRAAHAARTGSRKRSTSDLRDRLSLESDFAEARTWDEAQPVSEAPWLTAVIEDATSLVPLAASITLRLISCVVAPCCSTAAAMAPLTAEMRLMV